MDFIQKAVEDNINIKSRDETIASDNLNDLSNFEYEHGLRIFENQRKYTFHAPELSTASRKMDTALRGSTIEAFYTKRNNNTITTEDKLFNIPQGNRPTNTY